MSEQHPHSNITDAELLAYLDGETSQELAQLIEQSPTLRQRADQLAAVESHLHANLYRFVCPDTLSLGEYAAGILDTAQKSTIERHLHACPFCRQEVVQLHQYLGAVERDLRPTVLDRMRILVARLVPLSGTPGTPALAGVRGGPSGPQLYEAEGTQLSLEVQDDPERPGRRLILGLLLTDEPAGWQVSLYQEEQEVVTIAVDTLGNFVLSAIQPGKYELFLTRSETAIHVPEVSV